MNPVHLGDGEWELRVLVKDDAAPYRGPVNPDDFVAERAPQVVQDFEDDDFSEEGNGYDPA